MPKTNSKEMNKLLKLAAQQGWRIKEGRKGAHIKVFSPDKETIVTVALSSKSLRGLENAKSAFKKGGLRFK